MTTYHKPRSQAYPVFSVLRFALMDAEERRVLLSTQTEEQKERVGEANLPLLIQS